MTLQTDLEGFFAECRNWSHKGVTVYIQAAGAYAQLSAASPDMTVIVTCQDKQPIKILTHLLEEAGHTVRHGRWFSGDYNVENSEFWVAAVAYNSDDKMPGLWVDVFPFPPSVSEVTTKLLREFNDDGTLGKMENEEFHRMANPNIVILDPNEISGFLRNQTQENPAELEG